MSLFVVRRILASEYDFDGIPKAEWQYCAGFTTRKAATEHARRLDWAEKMSRPPAELDPFMWGAAWDQISTMPPSILRDWLRDEDIEPPPELDSVPAKDRRYGEVVLWARWWLKLVKSKRMTKAKWERVWLGLNKFTTFEVVKGDPDAALKRAKKAAVVYAVVQRGWYYNDEGFNGSNDLQEVYRTRAAAERARLRIEESTREAYGELWDDEVNEFVIVELPLDQVTEG